MSASAATAPAAASGAAAGTRAFVAATAGLTAIGFVLRLVELDQSLFGDEVFTHDIVAERGLGDVLATVRDTSITPPLHYVLAWLAVQFGDPEVTMRLPSLLLGTATVPVVALVGRRTVGTGPGLAAALIAAIGPFALFYGTEGRAYATLVFLLALSTLALVRALAPGASHGWWALFAATCAAALYTHYTAIFPLGAQAAWALWTHRDRWRPLLVSLGAAAVLWLPWLPAYLEQRRNEGIDAIDALYDLTAGELARGTVQVVGGLPFEPLRDVPGAVGLAALGAAVAIGLAALAADLLQGRVPDPGGAAPPRSASVGLAAALAVAAPVGIVVYGLVGTSIYAPRNLLASLPGIALLLGWLVARPRWPLNAAASAALVVALVIGAAQFLATEHRRPPWRQAAALLDAKARPGEPVVQLALFPVRDPLGRKPLVRSLEIPLTTPQRVVEVPAGDPAALRRAVRGARRAWIVVNQIPGLEGTPPPPRTGPGVRLVRGWAFDGFAPVAVYEYTVGG